MIKIYGTGTCPKCQMAKQYLKKKGVQFEEINILDAPEAADLFASQGIIALPILTLGNRAISGFSPKEIDELIKEVE